MNHIVSLKASNTVPVSADTLVFIKKILYSTSNLSLSSLKWIKAQRLWILVVATFLLAFIVTNCKDEDVGVVGVCPIVVSTNPDNNAVNVPLNQLISVTFNVPMDPATITQSAFSLTGSNSLKSAANDLSTSEITGTITYDAASFTMRFAPTNILSANVKYTCIVAATVKDLHRNALQTKYVWTFTTGNMLSPIVNSTDPASDEKCIAPDKLIHATFNIAMDSLSVNSSNFFVKQGTSLVPGNVSYTNKIATFKPTENFAIGTVYSATITKNVISAQGLKPESDFVWTFTVGCNAVTTILSTDPTNSATGVVLNKKITATFSEPMDVLSLIAANFSLKQGLTLVAGTVSHTATIISFTPTISLLPGTTYTGTITSGVKNAAGTPMPVNYIWSFNTGSLLAPTVTSTDPSNISPDVALDKVITMTFSEPMDPLSLTETVFLLNQGTTPISGTISYSGSTVSFKPAGNLLSGKVYTATVTNGAKSLYGSALAKNKVLSFTTVSTLGPQVINLKTAARFGIIAGAGISSNAGFSVINNMDVGISPGVLASVNGFPPATIVGGAIYASDAGGATTTMLAKAQADLAAAYLSAKAAISPAPATVSGDLGGTTLAPGIYKSTSTILIQLGNLTLDARGDANAVWIFQVASALTTIGGAPYPSASGGNVILTGGAQAKNVFWQVASSATIGDYTSFKGNILALQSITMNSFAQAEGRMLARNGSVVLISTNVINMP